MSLTSYFRLLNTHSVVQFGSEKALGKLNAPAKFNIHTKAPGLTPGGLSKSSIAKALAQSVAELGVESVSLCVVLRRKQFLG